MSIRDDEEFMIILDDYGQRYYSGEYYLTDPITQAYKQDHINSRDKLLDYIDKHIEGRRGVL
jgi:hypothetical protein